MASNRLVDLFAELEEVQLKELFLEVARQIPEARELAVEFLAEERGNLSLRRTVSVDNIVTSSSGFQVSTPALRKSKKKKSKIRCNGHMFVLHNYRKPTVCSFSNRALVGLVHQGYQCRFCLLDIHPKQMRAASACQGVQLAKARKLEQRKAKKKTKRKPKDAGVPKLKKIGSSLVRSSEDNDPMISPIAARTADLYGADQTGADDPTYIQTLPASPPSRVSGTPTSARGATPQRTVRHGGGGGGSVFAVTGAEGEATRTESAYGDEHSEEDEEDSDSEYYEENSSSDEEELELPEPDRGHAGSVNHFTHTVAEDAEDEGASDGNGDDGFVEDGMFADGGGRLRMRTGAKADWKSHSSSFRVRMTSSRPLTINTLKVFLEDSAAVAKQFDMMPQNRVNIVTMPKLTEGLNRYMNILPNNHTRVLLSQLGDDETSTYINANWMDGFDNKKDEFIAAQGPKDETVHSFWRMIWECSCHVIVMNTGIQENGVDKCVRYWPDAVGKSGDATKMVEDFKIVALESSKPCPEFTETTLQVTHDGETREIRHLWWTEWPDKGVPQTANGIGDYILRTRALQTKLGGPVCIHCSAGIGRTGCFLAINYCMQQFDKIGKVDILNCVCRLRQMRGMTVQTESQYRWIHMVMLRYMQGKLFKRESAGRGASTSGADEAQEHVLESRVKSDRPMSFQLTRRTSCKTLSRNVRTKSRESMMLVRKETDRRSQPSIKMLAGAEYRRNECCFRVKTFVRPTHCHTCEDLLTGLALQGLRCTGCKIDICARCLDSPPDRCVKKSNVKRQPSGLPSWPPRRPGKLNSRLGSIMSPTLSEGGE
eukprot:m.1302609 g.1302609  ORF g.1302609 m.1302609 type:complete len:825 (+) comp24808_c0_seq7:272-2746(+)